MLKDHSPITQALLGTLFTWALTAAGAALVVIIRGKQVSTQRRILPDGRVPLMPLASRTPFALESNPDRPRELNLTGASARARNSLLRSVQLHVPVRNARLPAALSTPLFPLYDTCLENRKYKGCKCEI